MVSVERGIVKAPQPEMGQPTNQDFVTLTHFSVRHLVAYLIVVR